MLMNVPYNCSGFYLFFKGCFHEVWCDSPQPEYTSLSMGLALSRFGLWPAGSQTVSLIPQESSCIPAALFFQLIIFPLVKSMRKQPLFTSYIRNCSSLQSIYLVMSHPLLLECSSINFQFFPINWYYYGPIQLAITLSLIEVLL